MQTIRVLVIDDSAFMRKVISDALNADPLIEVVGEATSGEDGIQIVKRLHPDVVTLDFEMPGWNGLQTLKEIIAIDPIPVVMVSSYTKDGASLTLECLSSGAVDFVCKPSGNQAYDIESISDQLQRKVAIAATVAGGHIAYTKQLHSVTSHVIHDIPKGTIIVIGASTGGPRTIEHIIAQLPGNLPCAILVVIHMPPKFTKSYAQHLSRISAVDVKEAEDGEEVLDGVIYIAPGDRQLRIRKGHEKKVVINLTDEISRSGYNPSIDITMSSCADMYGDHTLGIVLTGMGDDGVQGMRDIVKHGGKTIAQDEATSMVYGMPKRIIESIRVDRVLPEQEIATEMLKMLRRSAF